MILPRVICGSISPARSRTYNETTLALQSSAARSFQGRGTLKRDRNNLEPKPIDAILRRAAAMPPGPTTPECADPEMLAAYYDRSLAESERGRLEAHFADCARCQSQLSAISRADDRASEASPAFHLAWMRRWRIAIPLFAAAAALLFVVRATRPAGEVHHADQLAIAKHAAPAMELAAPASAPPAQIASAPQPPTNQLALNDARQAAPPVMHHVEHREEHRAKPVNRGAEIASAPAANTQQPEAPADAPRALVSSMRASVPKLHALQNAPTSPPSGAVYSDTGGRAIGAGAAQAMPGVGYGSAGSAIGGAVNATGPETLVMISPPAPATISAPQTNPPAAAVPGQTAVIGSATGAAAGAAVGAPLAGAQVAGMGIESNSTLSRGPIWMAGKQGLILFRDANGTTRRQYAGVEADLTAGTAPSETVCWIVGRNGTVIRTIDGENWTKIASPTDADLVAVAADSAQHAIVTTIAGRNFETSDGGISWHPQ